MACQSLEDVSVCTPEVIAISYRIIFVCTRFAHYSVSYFQVWCKRLKGYYFRSLEYVNYGLRQNHNFTRQNIKTIAYQRSGNLVLEKNTWGIVNRFSFKLLHAARFIKQLLSTVIKTGMLKFFSDVSR